jgi:hypothetical protein
VWCSACAAAHPRLLTPLPKSPLHPAGKSIWKLDDPAELRAERDARTAAAAEAARKKAANALAAKQRDVEKFEKLAALPEPQVGARPRRGAPWALHSSRGDGRVSCPQQQECA